jgi:ribosomal protein S18 acetylase RimI-like enzyme
MKKNVITIAPAALAQLDALMALEEKCFEIDRLSRRSMRRFISGEQSIFLTALHENSPVGYLLIIFYRGTRLARLYSLAVDPGWRGQGIAKQLMESGQSEALRRGAIHFRLEVAQTNTAAIQLYESLGFRKHSLLHNFYEDHSDALRLQKRIRHIEQSTVHINIPWFGQNTPFTCGPAALMMALAGLDRSYKPDLKEELRLWRETTTIYMTSGHGGCHPLGLALAAKRRGYSTEVWINKRGPLFIEGVRSEKKKTIMQIVHTDFENQSRKQGIKMHRKAIDQNGLRKACDEGAIPIVLISTYRLDRKKAPHWVVVSGYDEHCFYVHDPDFDEEEETPRDLQYIPIAAEDFDFMSAFGSTRLRCAIILSKSK